MSEIEKIKNIRNKTGFSLNEIKKAITEATGDEEKALKSLARLGSTMAARKSVRQVKEGIVETYVHSNRKIGSMLEVLCETDFVAKNEDFKKLAHDIAMHVVAMKPKDNEELLGQPFVKDQALTIKDLINNTIAKLGENIQIGRFEIFEI